MITSFDYVDNSFLNQTFISVSDTLITFWRN